MDMFLGFIDYIGKTNEGKYTYRFDFTNDTDTVWGEYFNISPTIIIPDLQPEKQLICRTARVDFDKEINIAKKNGCFSMQDCFDGIISLGFSKFTEEDIIYYNDEPLYFNFGEDFQVVEEKIKSCGYNFYNIIDNQIGDDTIIEDLIETITNEENELLLEYSRYEELYTFNVKENYDFNELKKLLFENNYTQVEYVEKEGQYTFRGYIIDIYSFKENYPIRLSFFGNTLEKIIKFNENTQLEIEKLETITIFKLK